MVEIIWLFISLLVNLDKESLMILAYNMKLVQLNPLKDLVKVDQKNSSAPELILVEPVLPSSQWEDSVPKSTLTLMQLLLIMDQ